MAAPRRPFLEVAEVLRPHGLRGAAVVALRSSEPDRLEPGSVLTDDQGANPLVVEAARPLKERFVVHFEGVTTPEAVDAMRGRVLYAPPIDRAGTLWVDELVGASVVDRDGAPLGRVTAVERNPASDLLVLEGGRLVPARFVVGDVVDHTVVVDVPEGLFE